MQGTWVRFRAKLSIHPALATSRETVNLAEQRPSMKRTAPIASRDARLDAQIDTFLAARHADPFALMGPHPTEGNWAVRFFLPWAAEASISLRPPAIEGATLPPARSGQLQNSGTHALRRVLRDIRSLCLSRCAQRVRSVSDGRGPPLRHLRKTRRPRDHARRRLRRSFRRLGPKRTACQRGGRLQSLGRPRPSHARPRLLRSLGNFRP